jgi:Transposase
MAQVEIITGKERRRGWPREQKEAILAEAFAPGVNIRAFSRQADISTGLLYKWRRTVWKMKREPAFARLVALAATAPATFSSGATVSSTCRRQCATHGSFETGLDRLSAFAPRMNLRYRVELSQAERDELSF